MICERVSDYVVKVDIFEQYWEIFFKISKIIMRKIPIISELYKLLQKVMSQKEWIFKLMALILISNWYSHPLSLLKLINNSEVTKRAKVKNLFLWLHYWRITKLAIDPLSNLDRKLISFPSLLSPVIYYYLNLTSQHY